MDRPSIRSGTVPGVTAPIWRPGQRSGGSHRLPSMATTGTSARTREEEEPILLQIPHLKRKPRRQEKRTRAMAEAKAQELLRRQDVERRFGVSRSWIYCEMRAGRFPEPIRIGKRAVRWKVVDLDEWAAGRPVAHGEIGHCSTSPRKSGV